MLYEINFDNTKNIKLNENIFNCSIKITILNTYRYLKNLTFDV